MLLGLYERRQVTESAGEFTRLLSAISLSTLMVVLAAFAFQADIARGWIVVLWLTAVLLVTLERVGLRRLVHTLNRRHVIGFRTVIGENAAEA